MDIKLENLIIDKSNKLLKIIDFGVSRYFKKDDFILASEGFYGTTAYMAPEQFIHTYNPEKVDIWACGILLYEILYSDIPWKKAYKTDKDFVDYQYYFKTYDKLLARKFYNNRYNKLFYCMLHLQPESRSSITYIKKLLHEITT